MLLVQLAQPDDPEMDAPPRRSAPRELAPGLLRLSRSGRRRPMKVVRVRYTPVAAGGVSRGRAAARYIARRPGQHGRTQREAFDAFTHDIPLEEAQERLTAWGDEHPRGYVYRIVLNPGEGHGHPEERLREWARLVMADLAQRHPELEWVGWVHMDHSAHDHVHILAILDRTLDRQELAFLRERAGIAWDRLERAREMARQVEAAWG